jgi:8-oxo-dGTP pyrophosphatase MutT (NUDIX family)
LAQETTALALTRRLGEWIDTRLGRNGIEPALQAGAIPYTLVRGTPVFLLITSRGTGRWIFPKGSPMKGYELWQVAAREAFEEAGVEGEVETAPIGSYRGLKGSLRSAPIEVQMYPLRVARQFDDWPEKESRHRHWVILAEARRLLSDPQLVEMAARVHQRALKPVQPEKAAITA